MPGRSVRRSIDRFPEFRKDFAVSSVSRVRRTTARTRMLPFGNTTGCEDSTAPARPFRPPAPPNARLSTHVDSVGLMIGFSSWAVGIHQRHNGNLSHVPVAAHRESSLPAPAVPADDECAVDCRRGWNLMTRVVWEHPAPALVLAAAALGAFAGPQRRRVDGLRRSFAASLGAVPAHDPQQQIEINRLQDRGDGAQCLRMHRGVDRTRHDGNRNAGQRRIAQLGAPEFMAAEPRHRQIQ
jgi:hypothetical protein